MEHEEQIEVAVSEDNGNVPAMVPETTPTETTETVTPTETTETVKPTEPELFELPDGRKVDGAGVLNEYISLQKDYTHKSQELAKVKTPETLTTKTADNLDPYSDPNYVPSSYKEIEDRAIQKAILAIKQEETDKIEQRQAIENQVVNQLSEIKKLDAGVNENSLFLHATKYQFKDLKLAYQNMKDMNILAKNIQQTTVKNIAKRNDPVSVSPGASGARPDPSQFENAKDYLRSLN